MKIINIYILLLLLVFISSCKKEEIEYTDLPDQVEMGQVMLYLNGEVVDYELRAGYDTVNQQIHFVFREEFVNDYINKLGFIFLPLKPGNYILHFERELYLGARSNFFQQRFEGEGWSYELDNPESGFFEISSLNQSDQTVEGKFRAKFKLKDKNGFKNTGLPESILFEGIFNVNYIRD